MLKPETKVRSLWNRGITGTIIGYGTLHREVQAGIFDRTESKIVETPVYLVQLDDVMASSDGHAAGAIQVITMDATKVEEIPS